MFLISITLYFMILHEVISLPQINLYHTDSISGNTNNDALKHNCLYVISPITNKNDARQIMFYCMGEWPSEWHIEKNNHDQNFTFATLYQQGITSQQLHRWSAPIDVVERYEHYLKQGGISDELSMDDQIFYNCTNGRFGPMCQYSLDDYEPYHTSLNEIIYDSYLHRSEMISMTCYTLLQCNRGVTSICLDWSEICDGKVDCIDGGRDEENCWQLEINECEKNEYRCLNGQCIPDRFFRDDPNIPDCLDRSDEILPQFSIYDKCMNSQPTFACDDASCSTANYGNNKIFISSCMSQYTNSMYPPIQANKPNSINDTCWSTFLCIIHLQNFEGPECSHCINYVSCEKIIRESCPYLILIPNGPIFFGNIYFGYTNNESRFYMSRTQEPQYLCYKEPMCDEIFSNASSFSYNNLTCRRPHPLEIIYDAGRGTWLSTVVIPVFTRLWQCYQSFNHSPTYCNKSNMYQCVNSSKCISKHRLNDRIVDCNYSDDEDMPIINDTCMSESLFKCMPENKCIPSRFIQDDSCDCIRIDRNICEDENPDIYQSEHHISFQTICDGFTELLPININGQNETDETNCEEYPCNNTYTRCDGIWNCFNGADEVDCKSSSLINCPPYHHICVSPYTNQLTCLPIEKANDGNMDCLGATDEPRLCRSIPDNNKDNKFYCRRHNESHCRLLYWLCNGISDCDGGDDERFCWYTNSNLSNHSSCDSSPRLCNDAGIFLDQRLSDTSKSYNVHFSLQKNQKLIADQNEHNQTAIFIPSTRKPNTHKREPRCHRGVHLRVWLSTEKNFTNSTCLCPPSFYGDQCQYQSQRVSLTMALQTFSDSWRTSFVLVVLLIDNGNERTIHSYEQFMYLSMQDCKIKFNIYLLYAVRPKKVDPTYYSIHIDVFEKISLKYRGSLLLPLNYSFLPVQRLAVILTIPRSGDDLQSCVDEHCIHGRCVKYSNSLNGTTFCQCHRGWSGRNCTISHNCTCSSDSLCIGHAINKRSVCVCPIGRFGSRCFLKNTACQNGQNGKCHNGGQCLPTDEHISLNRKFICICPKGFTGDQCEIVDTKIILSFGKDINLPQSIIVHFIQVIDNGPPDIANSLKTIPVHETKVTIYWSRPFHLVFLEFKNKNYYLAVVETTYNRSETLTKMIESSHRCKNISELFNETFLQWNLLHRIKLYHIPCQTRSRSLSCFYDEAHLCLCDDFGQQRLANCFEFNHRMKRDCFGQSGCENGAECFQNDPVCAQTSMCVCPPCFYGTRCQFSTHGFALSLDAILGYHIQPYASILNQPAAVKVSIALSTLMILIGFVNGILSFMTFRNKTLLKFGCSFYLLGSSITTLLTFTIFIFKFWILILAQMTLITNQKFLNVQCILIDFFLRISLTMNQWLNAYVTADRATTAIKRTNFDLRKNRKMAKLIIIVLLILTIVTSIHDPIHRRLIDDENEDERRTWCTINYSPHWKTFNSVMYIFHFTVPFLVNLISAILIICTTATQRATIRTHLSYRDNLYKQFREHYHLLTAPFVLVIIALPRLILSFVSGCMSSARDSWLFLVGYFVSLIPAMLTFILFVLPSTVYKKEFHKSVVQCRKVIQSFIFRHIE